MKTASAYMENRRSIPLHPPLARAFGDRAAIILQQIRYWMEINEQSESRQPETERLHYRDGRWWVFNTYEEWRSASFDFWSQSTIERHIRQLEKLGVLISDTFNKRSGDKTKWYTIDFEKMDAIVEQKEQELRASRQNDAMGITSKCCEHGSKLTKALPESTSDSKKTLATPTAVAAAATTKAPKTRARDPLFDLVAVHSFGFKPGFTNIQEGGRIGKIVAYLKGHDVKPSAKAPRKEYIRGCSPVVEADELARFYSTLKEYPARDIVKFAEQFGAWRSQHTNVTPIKLHFPTPVPDCKTCGGVTGAVLSDSQMIPCPACLAAEQESAHVNAA